MVARLYGSVFFILFFAITGTCLFGGNKAAWSQAAQESADESTPEKNQADQPSQSKPSPREKSVRDFFDRYQRTTNEDDASNLIQLYDFERLFELVLEEAMVDLPPPVLAQMKRATIAMTRQQLEALGERWTRYKIMQMTFAPDELSVDVFVRNWSEELGSSRTIYRLDKRSGQWKISDWKDLSMGFSTVSLTAAMLGDVMRGEANRNTQFAMRLMLSAMNAAAQGDDYGARTSLDEMIGIEIPISIERIRWSLAAAVNAQENPVYALECLDKLEAFEPGAAIASYLRVYAHLEIGNYPQVTQYANQYLGRFGDDPDTYLALGLAYSFLEQRDDCLKAYEAGLRDTPEALEILEEYALELPAEEKRKFLPYLKALAPTTDELEYLADSFEGSVDSAALNQLLSATSDIIGESELVNRGYYRAVAAQIEGRHSEAFKIADRKLSDLDELDEADDYLIWYEDVLCRAACRCGRSVQAYEKCKDQHEAMNLLLDGLDALENESDNDDSRVRIQQQIKSLEERYQSDYPNDAQMWLTLANHDFEMEREERAFDRYRKAAAAAMDTDDFESVLETVIEYFCYRGRSLEAYETIKPSKTVYQVLSSVMDQDSDEFQRITQLHREAHPNDVPFIASQIKAFKAAGDFEQALALLEQTLDKSDSAIETVADELKFQRMLLFAHVERFDDALIAAREYSDGELDFARALIFAIRQDRQRFRQAYLRATSAGYVNEEFTDHVAVPEKWLTRKTNQGEEVDQDGSRSYSPYLDVRRVVFLASQPVNVDAFSVREAMESNGKSIYELDRSDLTMDKTNFICEFQPGAVMVGCDGFKLFVSSAPATYPGDLESLMYSLENDDLAKEIGGHQAWLAIDVYAWPRDPDREAAQPIPVAATQLISNLSRTLLRSRGLVAIHADNRDIIQCDDRFFTLLESSEPVKAFQPPDSEQANPEQATAEQDRDSDQENTSIDQPSP